MSMLFSAYRLDQYASPDGFIAQAALVMSYYATDVVEYVTDPHSTGIQRRSKWPPTINELGDALESAKKVIAGTKIMAEKMAQGIVWDCQLNKYVPRLLTKPQLAKGR